MKIILSLIAAFCVSSAYAQSTSVKIWDGTDTAGVTGGALDVNATLDTTGLATEAKQDTGNTSLASIDGKITACNTGAVTVSSSALPTGAATSALQTTGNTSLATLAGAVSGTEMQVDVLTLPAVSGTVTCDAGTNLNTSALATEATLSTLNGKVTACNTGAVTISSFPDNEPVNVAQMNGVAVSMGNGASGTGVQRVTIASDSTGQITCNAGTNLNTSALATSANQATEIASLSVLDDWDESDRAKVNPIVGQAGVAGGSGTVGSTTQRVVSASDVGAPLATNYGTIYQGTTALTVKRAIVAESSSGDNEVVAGVTSKKIVVLSARIIASGAVNAKFRSNTTDIDGLAYLTTNSGYVLPYNPAGWFVTAAGEALNLNLSGAVAVGGTVQYVEAD